MGCGWDSGWQSGHVIQPQDTGSNPVVGNFNPTLN